MKTGKILQVTMPDASVWEIPAEIVAKDYAGRAVITDPSADFEEKFSCMMDDRHALISWATESMDSKNVARHAHKILPPVYEVMDFQKGWVKGEKRMIEGELYPPLSPKEEETANEFEQLGREIGSLVDQKQKAYGDSFGRSGKMLRVLYPDGIAPGQYDDALAIVRIVDKLFRVANNRDAFGESPGRDISGYGMLMARMHEVEK